MPTSICVGQLRQPCAKSKSYTGGSLNRVGSNTGAVGINNLLLRIVRPCHQYVVRLDNNIGFFFDGGDIVARFIEAGANSKNFDANFGIGGKGGAAYAAHRTDQCIGWQDRQYSANALGPQNGSRKKL